MKKSNQRSPLWPYLGILALLFLLSLTAPRAWQRHTRRELGRLPTPRTSSQWEQPLENWVDLEVVDESELEPRPLDPPPAAPVVPDTVPPPAADPLIPPAPQFAADVIEEPLLADMPPEPEVPAAGDPAPAAEPQPAPEPAPAPIASGWPLPRVLIEQLTALAQEDPQLVWAGRAVALIRELCLVHTNAESARQILAALAALADDETPAADPALAGQVLRARYGLKRWVDLWTAAVALGDDVERPPLDAEPARRALAEFDVLVADKEQGRAWRDYLQLAALRSALAEGESDDVRRAAARGVLDRLASTRLTRAQRKFIDGSPLAGLREALRPLAAEGVTATRLLAHLEQYEYSGLASDGYLVADDYRGLAYSAPNAAVELSRQLDTHYRNANVRIALNEELFNRLVPQPDRMDERVRDTVVNVPVRGRASTFTTLSIKLVDDPRRIRFGLEASGVVASNTFATSGPATFHNTGQSTFLVKKLFLLAPDGLVVFPAIAEAENNYNNLISLETDYDGVPLVGSLVRNIARNQHDESRGEASRETAQKVAIRALNQLDREVSKQLSEAGKNLEKNQAATLRRLGLELVPVSLATADRRAVARVRLAAPEQLGAHTPRPRAPSDSWFSWQLHQSALNNGLEQLDLEGRTFELPQLFEWIARKLGRPDLAQQDDLPEDVRLTFAEKDAVHLRCENGVVEVTLALADLKHEGSRWRNFKVRTTYTPVADGRSPRFARNDTIHLDGRSVKGKLQLKLRAIFSRVLSKNRDLKLLDDSITEDPRLQDLAISQFTVVDGWIALAYSQRRQSSRVAHQPE